MDSPSSNAGSGDRSGSTHGRYGDQTSTSTSHRSGSDGGGGGIGRISRVGAGNGSMHATGNVGISACRPSMGTHSSSGVGRAGGSNSISRQNSYNGSLQTTATDDVEPCFSDGEEEPAPKPMGVSSDASDGFDFSGTVSASAWHPVCVICNEPFQVSWSSEREELVVTDAVLLRHVIYHSACVATRALHTLRPP